MIEGDPAVPTLHDLALAVQRTLVLLTVAEVALRRSTSNNLIHDAEKLVLRRHEYRVAADALAAHIGLND